jgi:ribosomal-protein-alanine N-acetyltransferase
MKIHIETERLIMRNLTEQDAQGLFELDSEPKVHTYLGNKPIKTLNEAEKIISFIKEQYTKNGIGRWAVIENKSGDFIGWSGFKLITNVINNRAQYYDLGYRFIKKSWGKGYATETAIASLDFGFNQLNQKEIYAMAHIENLASDRILQK